MVLSQIDDLLDHLNLSKFVPVSQFVFKTASLLLIFLHTPNVRCFLDFGFADHEFVGIEWFGVVDVEVVVI